VSFQSCGEATEHHIRNTNVGIQKEAFAETSKDMIPEKGE
jgi:hypothetical protein